MRSGFSIIKITMFQIYWKDRINPRTMSTFVIGYPLWLVAYEDCRLLWIARLKLNSCGEILSPTINTSEKWAENSPNIG